MHEARETGDTPDQVQAAGPLGTLLEDHVFRFNAGVCTGDWAAMPELFADDAELEFVGIPVGPLAGRDAIAAAYAEQPPGDEIVLPDGGPRYAWSREPDRPAGEIQITARDRRIQRLTVLYKTFSS